MFFLRIAVFGLIQLTDVQSNRMVVLSQMPAYVDKTHSVTFEQISVDTAIFKYDLLYNPAVYDEQSAYWILLKFSIPEDGYSYLIEIPDQSIDSIDIYLKHETDQTYKHFYFGDQYPFDYRLLDHKNFHVKLQKSGNYIGFARFRSAEYADIRLNYRTVEGFIEYALTEYYVYGIFYGMILIISLYNLFIFTAIRELKYLYYTFYIVSVGLFAMSVDGIAYQKFWPDSPGWNNIAHGVALFSIIFWSIVFSRRFLRLNIFAPLIDRLLLIIFYLRIGVFIYGISINPAIFQYRYIEVIPLSIIFYGSIVTFYKGYKPARFFIVAYGFLFAGFLIKALMMYGIIPTTYTEKPMIQIISYYSIHLSFVLEMLFLSVALSDRIRILKINRDKAYRRIVQQQSDHIKYKDEINAQLEERIVLRTEELSLKNRELELTNRALHDQKREISQINNLLDLENYKLRNNIQSLQKDRILRKLLSYVEFAQIFDTDEKCLELIATHKWKNGYSCQKCENVKFISYQDRKARRCSKCGYVETATAATPFHAAKIPLSKALYLLYIYLNHTTDNLVEFSKELQLRTSVVRSFEGKIRLYVEKQGAVQIDVFGEMELNSSVLRA